MIPETPVEPEQPAAPPPHDDQTANYGVPPPVQPLASKSPIHCVTIVGQIEGHMVLPPQTDDEV